MKKLQILLLFFCCFISQAYTQAEIYELREYEFEFFRSTEVFYNYLEKALIPAMNRQGSAHIGVFEETGEALPKKVYLLIPYPSMDAFEKAPSKLANDAAFQQAAETYWKAPPESIPYKSITTSLMRAASGFPRLIKPAEDSELFELRIYESYNEDALRRKVKMFNDHEFDIFEEVGLNTVFFGENIAGPRMPCLTYLLAFKDKAAHAQAWSRFGPHPEWQRITKLAEYQDAMNDITRVFLKPMPFSQL